MLIADGVHALLAPAPGQRLLEIGAGHGTYALEVASAVLPGGAITMVDDQPHLLDQALRCAHERGLANVSAAFADVRLLPFEDDSFDAAYLVAALGRFFDVHAALPEIARVVAPTGRIVVGELHGDPHMVGPATLRTLAARAGLDVVRRTTVDCGHLSALAAKRDGTQREV
jgi:ubiquinone/menaquinone biosynthesis C-methylase UbiE